MAVSAFSDEEKLLDTLNNKRWILHYRFDLHTIHDLSNRLQLDLLSVAVLFQPLSS